MRECPVFLYENGNIFMCVIKKKRVEVKGSKKGKNKNEIQFVLVFC